MLPELENNPNGSNLNPAHADWRNQILLQRSPNKTEKYCFNKSHMHSHAEETAFNVNRPSNQENQTETKTSSS